MNMVPIFLVYSTNLPELSRLTRCAGSGTLSPMNTMDLMLSNVYPHCYMLADRHDWNPIPSSEAGVGCEEWWTGRNVARRHRAHTKNSSIPWHPLASCVACRSVVGASRKKALVLRRTYEIVGESFPHPNGLFHSARTPRPCGRYRLHDRRHEWRRALLVTVAFTYSLLGFDPSAHTQVYLFHLHVHALAWSC